MAVQQNKKSPSKRGMHRAHDALSAPPLAVESTTGEVHLRHHISPSGPRSQGRQDQGRISWHGSNGAAPRATAPFSCPPSEKPGQTHGCHRSDRLHGW